MNSEAPIFTVSLAKTDADIRAAQRLRYAVFVDELGATGPMVDHDAGLECDRFDVHATHFLLRDTMRPADDQVVGVYRVITAEGAAAAGQFYCDDEFDLTLLKQSGLRLLELGRSCLHPDYRGGAGLMYLWAALSDYVAKNEIDLLFGVASFHGTDVDTLAGPLSLLHARHLAPKAVRVTPRPVSAQAMDLVPPDQIDRLAALRDTPALIKAYLRLGGVVGDGAFIDRDFNTIDVCLILSMQAVDEMRRSIVARGYGGG